MQGLDRIPIVTLSDTVASHAKFRSDRLALISGDRRLTWRELDRRVTLVANGLLASGLAPGDKVALLAANCPEMVEILLGINRAGCVSVPLSLLAPADGLARMLDDSGSRALFVTAGCDRLIEPHLPALPSIEPHRRLAIGFDPPGWVRYEPWRDGQNQSPPRIKRSAGDECNIIYSSGTTGVPKGIVHSHYARQQFGLAIGLELGFTPQSVALATTPLYSNGTWLMFLPALTTGATLVVMSKFDPAVFFDLVAAERVTQVFMVPPQFVALLGHPGLDRADLGSLEVILSAGSPLRPETKRAIIERMGPKLMELYGLTEGVRTILRPEDVMRKTASVGTPGLGTDFRIIDDEGNELPRGAIGEIIGYGSGFMNGYHNRPDATAEVVWMAEDGRTYLRTGDIGRLDDEGFLYILDRKKDMILSGGFNVYPHDIEAVAATHPEVAEVAVIGIADPRWDEVPIALVVPRPGAAADTAQIKEWINQRVGKHQRVARVELRTDFPRNALGKVLKKELRAEYAS